MQILNNLFILFHPLTVSMKTIITTTIFFLIFFFANGQSPLQKRIDFSVKKVPLKNALQKLSYTSEINIAFSSNFFDKRNRVSIQAKNETLEYILQQLLVGTNVIFKASGNQIVLLKTKPIKIPNFTISGYLEDKASGERLIGAHIYSPKHKKGTTSNEYGFYSLTLPKGITEIIFNYLGAKEIVKSIDLTRSIRKDFSLETSINLSEIIVSSKQFSLSSTADELPKNNAKILEELKEMPANDPVQQTALLAGVENGIDRFGGFYVRGGNQDQNLMLMDGVPVYNTSHMAGLFSIYNSNTIRNAKLYKGGIPARYGGRLSSVYDVRTKEGNNKYFEGEIGTNILSSSFTFQGPIKKDKSSFFISGRRTLVDYFLQTLIKIDGDNSGDDLFGIRFYDINAKFNFKLSSKDKLYISFYSGDDAIAVSSTSQNLFEDEFFSDTLSLNAKWGNQILALRWNRLYDHKLFSNTTFTYSNYNFGVNLLENSESINDITDEFIEGEFEFGEIRTKVREVGLKMDFDYVHSPKQYFRFGSSVLIYGFKQNAINLFEEYEVDINPDIEELSELNDQGRAYATIELGAYIEDDIQWSEKFKTNLGMRLTCYNPDEDISVFLEPRLIGQYSFNKNLLANISYTRNTQYLHLLTTGISLPVDVWLPSVNELKPQIGQQSTLGLFYKTKNDFNASVEGFYKQMKNVIENRGAFFEEETSSFIISDSTFTVGKGKSYGLEFSMDKKFNKLFTFFNYTLSKTTREFEDINQGKPFPFLYDRRHSIKVGFNWQITKKMNFASSWTFHTGTPRAILNQLLQFDQDDVELFNPIGNYNAVRTPYFHRLDTSVRFVFPRKHTTHVLKLGAFNTYNQRNHIFYTIETFNGTPKLTPNHFISFFPQLTYTVKFDFSKKN